MTASDTSNDSTVFSLSEQETEDLGGSIARRLRGGELILLEGDLGMGKTIFARGMAIGIGVAGEDVSSPSFTLVQSYEGGRLPFHHVDLYRLEGSMEFEELGFEHLLDSGGVVVVEWGDRLPAWLRRGATLVRFYDMGEGARRIEIGSADAVPVHRDGDA